LASVEFCTYGRTGRRKVTRESGKNQRISPAPRYLITSQHAVHKLPAARHFEVLFRRQRVPRMFHAVMALEEIGAHLEQKPFVLVQFTMELSLNTINLVKQPWHNFGNEVQRPSVSASPSSAARRPACRASRISRSASPSRCLGTCTWNSRLGSTCGPTRIAGISLA